jgi:hypothetical protein
LQSSQFICSHSQQKESYNCIVTEYIQFGLGI